MGLAYVPLAIWNFFSSYGLLGQIALCVPLSICTLLLMVSIILRPSHNP